MATDRSLGDWTRRVMGVATAGGSTAARTGRGGRARRTWDPDAPPPPEGDEALPGPQDLSWFDSSLALARGLDVIEHSQLPPEALSPEGPAGPAPEADPSAPRDPI